MLIPNVILPGFWGGSAGAQNHRTACSIMCRYACLVSLRALHACHLRSHALHAVKAFVNIECRAAS